MKDPADDRHRAYESLGLKLGATKDQVTAAYEQATANPANATRLPELTSAWYALTRARPRLEEDFWHYDEPPAQGAGVPVAPGAEGLAVEPALAVILTDDQVSELNVEECGASEPRPPAAEVRLTPVPELWPGLTWPDLVDWR
jgi:hypothetical protein